MDVKLVQATENTEEFLANIASICYGKEEAKNPSRLLVNLHKLGHHSVFEHAYYTFKIEGISRACLAQLTRHRHASYTVRSQGYCSEEATEFIVPGVAGTNEVASDIFNDVYRFAQDSYDHLIELGVKREDARFVLPEATTTELYMSLNLRELLHLDDIRNTKQAQWEIRELTQEMIKLVLTHSPELMPLFKE